MNQNNIQKAYDDGYKHGREDAIDELCKSFKEDWDNQCENNMEDCINWYDWLIACAKQIKE